MRNKQKHRFPLNAFPLHTQPLSNVVCNHGCVHHKYAHDTQREVSAPPTDLPPLLHNMELGISAVKDWLMCNKLQLSDGNTAFLLCYTIWNCAFLQ